MRQYIQKFRGDEISRYLLWEFSKGLSFVGFRGLGQNLRSPRNLIPAKFYPSKVLRFVVYKLLHLMQVNNLSFIGLQNTKRKGKQVS